MADIQLTNGNDKYEHAQGQNWSNIYGLDGDDDLKVNRNGALIGGKGNDKLHPPSLTMADGADRLVTGTHPKPSMLIWNWALP